MDGNESWMERLPVHLKGIPLCNLAIPGSHESTTNALNVKMPIACDMPRWLHFAGCPGVKRIIRRWSQCQSLSLHQQLCSGVRYIDLRVGCYSRKHNVFAVHGLYGPSVTDVVEQVLAFLAQNPYELVILDFNHFYAFNRRKHLHLIGLLLEKFNSKLVPSPPGVDVRQFSLDQAHAHRYQVILFYQECKYNIEHPLIWTSKHIRSPWANTNNVQQLVPYLEKALRQKDSTLPEGGFFVTQGILTPTLRDIVCNWRGSLKNHMALQASRETISWLKSSQQTVQSLLNIVIVDFVEFIEFCDTIIKFNMNK
uniref:PLCXc domain-containing protein n=1 Tax=Trichuris muris TaxID=70415 RepID=A0A5S6QVZ5_TRIMR